MDSNQMLAERGEDKGGIVGGQSTCNISPPCDGQKKACKWGFVGLFVDQGFVSRRFWLQRHIKI